MPSVMSLPLSPRNAYHGAGDLGSFALPGIAQNIVSAAQQIGAGVGDITHLSDSIEWITVESAYSPLITLNPSAGGAQGGIMKLFKPKLTIKLNGINPIPMAPWGDPGESKWPYVQLTIAAGLGVLSGLIARSIIVGVGGGIASALLMDSVVKRFNAGM